jgi:hypothetical protein
MRKLLIYIIPALLLAALAGWQLDVARIYAVLQPATVCLSIMAAAIFVRLNRGMPTVDWKSIKPTDRQQLTTSVVDLAVDYLVGLALTFTTLMSIMVLTAATKNDVLLLPHLFQQLVVGVFVALSLLSIIWMGYVIWRDYDIVLLQQRVIDDAAKQDITDHNRKIAESKIEDARSANLKSEPTPIVPWRN